MQKNRFTIGRIILHSSGLVRRLALLLVFLPLACEAVPSFARQVNMQCIACHTEFPVLNEFGRQFKLGGYTLATGLTRLPPIAVMLQPSFTRTEMAQAGGAAPGFGANNNAALTQASIFYAGRLFGPYAADIFGATHADLANKFGIFMQVTYDGIGKAWAWDNTELRFADSATVSGKNITYGAYLNNNPTMQDPWNSTPAWGFPFTGSGLAPGPAAATLIDGGLAGQVAGAGGYAMIDNTLYVDIAGYRSLGVHAQKSFGVDPEGETQLSAVMPYWRLALTRPIGAGVWEFGTFGLAADTFPGRDSSAGHDRLVDVGLDTQYQENFDRSSVTFLASWIHEHQDWSASEALGATSNTTDRLRNFKASVVYLYDWTYGLTGQYFKTSGDRDTLLYADSATGSPLSEGFVLQANFMPWNKGGGPAAWPRSNIKLSVQYTYYTRFNGARTDFDGAGTNARDNNTLYFEAWIVF